MVSVIVTYGIGVAVGCEQMDDRVYFIPAV